MSRIVSSVREALSREDARALYVGFSGGLDSTALLLAVHQAIQGSVGLGLIALHVDHQLQAESAAWDAHCAEVCRSLHVGYHSAAVAVDGNGNLEANAREARYGFFASQISTGGVLLLAHHLDDQVETVLLRLFQGRGFTPMAASGGHHGLRILRPLLGFSKEQLSEYVTGAGYAWIDDASNEDLSFDRNYLRGSVIPHLKARFDGFDGSIVRTAAIHGALTRLVARQLGENLLVSALPEDEIEAQVLLRMWLARRDVYAVTDRALAEFVAQIRRGDAAAIDLPEGRQLMRSGDRVDLSERG